MNSRLFKVIRLCYYLLIFLTPLVMSNATSEMFEFPKILLIYIFSFTILALWLIDVILSRRSIHVPSLAISVGIFVVSQMLATATSVDVHTSIFGYYGRFNGGLLSIVTYSILFFVALQVFDIRSFRTLLKVSLIASFLVLAWGLPGRTIGIDMSCILFRGEFSTACWTNEFRPQERMFSTLGQPNWLGVYLIVHFFIGIFLWYTKIERANGKHFLGFTKRNVIYIAYVLLALFGVVFTGSRSSQIGLIGGIVVLALILLWKQQKKSQVRLLVLLITINAIVFGAWYGYRLLKSQSNSITHSGTIRLIVWEGALKLAARYPLTGTGPETFAYTYFLTRPEAHNNTTERDLIYNKAHNEFLNFLATTGVIGLSAYVYMLTMMFRKNTQSIGGQILASGIVAMSIANFFGFSTTTGQLLLFLLPIYGLLSKTNLAHSSVPLSKPRIPWILVPIIVGVWIMMMRYFISYYRADIKYAQATGLQYASAFIESIDAFTEALNYRFEHIYADKFALTIAQTAYVLHEADTDKQYGEQIQAYSKMAENIQTAAIRSSPRNPLYWKDRVKMYQLIEEVLSKREKKDVALQIKTAITEATKLAPTDLEVREMRNSKE